MQVLKEQNGGLNGGLNGIESNKTIEEKIIECLKEDNSLSILEISYIINASLRTTERAIRYLKESGKIKRTGSKKSGSWQIIE